MTDPVILLGTQSNGETLPVQVDAFGRLVAEGLQGSEGPQGPEGPAGGSFPLPADPYEGALLGWLNGELSWVGTPPVPIPPGAFGPITEVTNDYIAVAEEVPASIGTGVYLWQVDSTGTRYSKGSNTSLPFTSLTTGNYDISNLINGFDGDLSTSTQCFNGVFNDVPPKGFYGFEIDFSSGPIPGPISVYSPMSPQGPYDGRYNINKGSGYGPDISCIQRGWKEVAAQGEQMHGLRVRASQNGCSFSAIKSGENILLDPSLGANIRVNNIMDNLIVGVANNLELFEVGQYLSVPEQRVAPWVLYGNDPTSLIDHLRSS